MSADLIHPSATIDPRAIVDKTARIGEGAIVEAGAVVGPACVIGARTRLRHYAVVVEHTTLGTDNDVHPGCVLGGDPQDRAFKGDVRGELLIGDLNIFREGVTISRPTQNGPPTRIGSGNFFMTLSHAGHNCQVGDNNTFANGAALAGHVRLGNGVVMSACALVHQFTNVGDGAMFQGTSKAGMHIPPYMIVSGLNRICGINRIGLRRNPQMQPRDRDDIKELYRLVMRNRGAAPLLKTAEDLLASREWGLAGRNFLTFIINALNEAPPRARGVCGTRVRREEAAALDAE